MSKPLADRLARLARLHPTAIDLSLARIERLLAALGDPQSRLAPVIHIAGTNGKGSTLAFLRAILEAAGQTVHVYTSPHLVRFNERIRLAGRLIDDETLIGVLDESLAANADQPITFFEITTAAAFLAFSRVPADVVLLETGLGGRLDATNMVARPALTLLSPIGLDHQAYLGDTLAAIAAEKAGILKPGVPCVLVKQERAAMKVIEARADSLGVPLHLEGRDWHLRGQGDKLIYESRNATRGPLPVPVLTGPHQRHNAGLAIAALDRLEGIAVPDPAVFEGLMRADWPARLQRLRHGPLVASLSFGWEIWLDGGHNPQAGKALAAQARLWRDKPLHLVLGMLASKDVRGFLKPLAARLESFWAVPVAADQPTLDPSAIVAAAKAEGIAPAQAAGSVEAALTAILASDPRPGRILIAGSLYLAGAVLENAS